MNNSVSIVYQSSDAYAFLAGVSMCSLYKNNQHIHELNVYVLNVGISPGNIEKLEKIAANFKRNIIFVDTAAYEKKLQSYGIPAWNGSYATYMKLFLSELLPEEIDRILYLDCDTIINGSIDSLWEYDLKNSYIAMAIDCMNPKHKKKYGINYSQKYFNAGVILFSLNKWRDNKCIRKVISFLKDEKMAVSFADQDLLNICFYQAIEELPMKYNCISLYGEFSYQNICYMYGLEESIFYTQADYKSDVNNPVIIHFPSVFLSKPWFQDYTYRWKDIFDLYLYDKAYSFTNYKKPPSGSMSKMKRLQQKMYKVLPLNLFIKIQKIASNLNAHVE